MLDRCILALTSYQQLNIGKRKNEYKDRFFILFRGFGQRKKEDDILKFCLPTLSGFSDFRRGYYSKFCFLLGNK